jgi:uncharacterized membrane protein YraQ (UPF0718 family)
MTGPRESVATRYRPPPAAVLLVVAILAALVGPNLYYLLAGTSRAVETWSTVFVAVSVQAFPFLVLGVVLSGIIAAFVPDAVFERLPRHPVAAVPAAGLAGAVLPGCECASVPVAGGLMARGVAPPAALAFLLSAPAINPVVLVSTAVAFPQEPRMVLARFTASLATAVGAGWIWARFGRAEWLRLPTRRFTGSGPKVNVFRLTVQHDLLHAGGFLVIGAATAATLNVLVPPEWIRGIGGSVVASVLVLAALAVLLAVCSEADAFVAASLTGFSLTARLVFLVVGPVVDVKLIALQSGTFGRAFAARFAPMVFVTAVVVAVVTGRILL